MELGRAAREEAEALAKVGLQGYRIKQDMIKEGKVIQDERVGQVAGSKQFTLLHFFKSILGYFQLS